MNMNPLNSSQKKTFAMLAILMIVAVAIASAFILAGSNNGTSYDDIDSQLMIRGNANNDYTINDSDLEIIQDIISGEKDIDDYPLADANDDGLVNDEDVELVEKIINRESTDLYVICLDTNGDQTSVKVSYPLINIVPFGTNIVEPLLNVGGGEYCVGYFTSTYSNAEKSMTDNAVDLEGSSRTISDAAWKNFTDLDSDVGIGALIVDYSAIGAITDSYLEDLDEAGIPMICYASADASDEICAALTLGFLLGTDCEETALDYAELSWSVINEVNEKLSSLSESDRKSYICLTMWIYICQNDSTFNTTPGYAGGIAYYEVNSEFAETYSGTSSTKMQSTEALSNYGDADFLISNRSIDYGSDNDSVIVAQWEKYIEYFEELDNYENLVYVNNLLPGACKIAYLAYAMYPDTFSLDWANGIMEEFMDEFEPFEGYSLDNIITIFTYDDYINAKN